MRKKHTILYFPINKLSTWMCRLGYVVYRWNRNRDERFEREIQKEHFKSLSPSNILDIIDFETIQPRKEKLRKEK